MNDLSPVMSVPEDALQSRINFHSLYVADVDAEIIRLGYDDNHRLWYRAHLFAKNITSRYGQYRNHISLFEYDLHDLWYLIIQAAKITSADHPAQDRLASQVIHIREMGVISRKTSKPQEEDTIGDFREEALTSKGRIWVDLPFLVDEIREAWGKTMPHRQRHNLSAFVARLTSWGICDPDISLCAIWILRDTLESPRPLVGMDDSQSNKDGHELNQDTPISMLLPAAVSWFEYCGYKLETLCIINQDFELSTIGDLARDANVSPASGFSVSRWHFWKSRLEEICHCDNQEVATLAFRGSKTMSFWGERIEGKT